RRGRASRLVAGPMGGDRLGFGGHGSVDLADRATPPVAPRRGRRSPTGALVRGGWVRSGRTRAGRARARARVCLRDSPHGRARARIGTGRWQAGGYGWRLSFDAAGGRGPAPADVAAATLATDNH